MFSVFSSYIFNSEVIYHQCETDRTPLMGPKSGCGFTLEVSVFVELLREELLRKNTALGQTIHPAFDRDVHIPVLCCLACQIIMLNDVVWYVSKLQADVLFALSGVIR